MEELKPCLRVVAILCALQCEQLWCLLMGRCSPPGHFVGEPPLVTGGAADHREIRAKARAYHSRGSFHVFVNLPLSSSPMKFPLHPLETKKTCIIPNIL